MARHHPRHPGEAEWLSAAERDYIEKSRTAEGEPLKNQGPFKAAFSSPIVWLFALIYTLTQLGLLGLSMWLPSVLKRPSTPT